MTSRIERFEEFTPEQLRVSRLRDTLQRDGGTPAGALESLASVMRDEVWKHVPDRNGRPFRNFSVFVQTQPPFGLGYEPEQLRKLLDLKHPHEHVRHIAEEMAWMRNEVRTQLKRETAPAQAAIHAGPGRGKKTDGATIGFLPNSAETVLARLKRDDPAMAEQVVSGELTANAAARQKGWRYPRILVTSPESVAKSLRKHLSDEQIHELILALSQEDS